MNWAVIMAGGYGERFWPMSRRTRPKQLLPIVGKKTMIQQTVDRVRPLFGDARILVVTSHEQAREVRRQLPRIRQVVSEPMGRNTAPCIGLAMAIIGRHDPDAVIAVLPADACIHDQKRYREVLAGTLDLAGRQDVLVTIGIQPTAPHTGYGYIQLGEPLETGFWKARRFVEKPDQATAEQFLASGDYRWNAGMFVWSLRSAQEAYRRYQPSMAAGCERIQKAVGTRAFARTVAREFQKMEKISVDYAIMEKAGNVVVANGDFDWDDVGDWPAIARHSDKDAAGNVARGEFVGVNTADCVVVSAEKEHLVGAVGVKDLVIVHTKDATLVCAKSEAQKVRDLVKQLAGQGKYRRAL
jgi:mannose-1-phosphate guanylyltransferase